LSPVSRSPVSLSPVSRIFSQVLKSIPRSGFDRAVRRHKAERNTKGFTCWGQLAAKLFCQPGSVNSLRDISNGLAASEGKPRRLGLPAAPRRSTLAYANAHRPWQLFEDVFGQLLDVARDLAQQAGARHKFRFKNKLFSIDATVIELCASVFDWAQFRRTNPGVPTDRSWSVGWKGAVKLHPMLDQDGLPPCYGVIAEGKQHEVAVTRQWSFPPGAIPVFDRGYNDYARFERLGAEGIFFATRMKDNADYLVVEDRPLPQRVGLRSDRIVCMTGQAAQGDQPHLLPRIELHDEQQKRTSVFSTNHMKLAAATIPVVLTGPSRSSCFSRRSNSPVRRRPSREPRPTPRRRRSGRRRSPCCRSRSCTCNRASDGTCPTSWSCSAGNRSSIATCGNGFTIPSRRRRRSGCRCNRASLNLDSRTLCTGNYPRIPTS